MFNIGEEEYCTAVDDVSCNNYCYNSEKKFVPTTQTTKLCAVLNGNNCFCDHLETKKFSVKSTFKDFFICFASVV